jgi:hypothetical protein
VVASILASSEYYGLLIDENFQTLYGRMPNPDTRAHYIAQMQDGLTQEQVLGAILCRSDLWDAAIMEGYRRRIGDG